MAITGIEGDIGAGKTLVMTHLLVEEYKKFRKPIITNYHLRGIPHKYITLEDLMDMCEREEDLSNCALGLDEMHIWADSRLSASKKNRLFTYFVLQTGKEDINMYYTTQDFFQVDIRVRKQTRFGIHVRKKGDLHLLTIKNLMRPQQRIPPAVVHGKEVWDYYYTREKVRLTKPSSG